MIRTPSLARIHMHAQFGVRTACLRFGLVKLASRGGGFHRALCAAGGEEVQLSPEVESASRFRRKRCQATRTPNQHLQNHH